MEVILGSVMVFLLASVVIVPITKRLRLGSVLGYLLAGLPIGHWGLSIIPDGEVILHSGEIAVDGGRRAVRSRAINASRSGIVGRGSSARRAMMERRARNRRRHKA